MKGQIQVLDSGALGITANRQELAQGIIVTRVHSCSVEIQMCVRARRREKVARIG